MITSALHTPLTAFSAFGLGINSVAHNLANVATDGFKHGRVTYSDRPRQSGVAANGPQKMGTPGALAWKGEGLPGGGGYVETSNTDIPTEMVTSIALSRGYQANAKTVQTGDAMLGMVIDMIA